MAGLIVQFQAEMTVVWSTNAGSGCFLSGRSEGEVSRAKVRLTCLWGLSLGVKGNQPKEQLSGQWQYANEKRDGPFGCWFTFPYVLHENLHCLRVIRFLWKCPYTILTVLFTESFKSQKLLAQWIVAMQEMPKNRDLNKKSLEHVKHFDVNTKTSNTFRCN